uniref:Uncharacterized protein n=1 Tax=Moniliophthora roreri TaxID=221103 RepID=A0A0W0G9L4_MONRR
MPPMTRSTSANLRKQTLSCRASSTEDGRVRKTGTFVPEELDARDRRQSLETVHESYAPPCSPFGGPLPELTPSPSPSLAPSDHGTFVSMSTPRLTSRLSPAPGSPLQPRPSLYSPKGIPAPLREPTPVLPTSPFSFGGTPTSSPQPSPLPNSADDGSRMSWIRPFEISASAKTCVIQDSFAGNYRILVSAEIHEYLSKTDGIYAGVQCYIPKSTERFQCGPFFDPGIVSPFFDVFNNAHVYMFNFQVLTDIGHFAVHGKSDFVPSYLMDLSNTRVLPFDQLTSTPALEANIGVIGMHGPHGHFFMKRNTHGLFEGRFSLKNRGVGLEDIAFEFYAAPCLIGANDTIIGPARRIADEDFLRMTLELQDMYGRT